MTTLVKIPTHNEEDALARIVEWLRSTKKRTYPQMSADLHIPDLLHGIQEEVRRNTPALQRAGGYTMDPQSNVDGFYAAAWSLVARTVLRPVSTSQLTIGSTFALTEYGRRWIEATLDTDWVPNQSSRLATVLAGHSARFGPGFSSRALEAVACYRAQTYLACCTMCGAASESITLRLAGARLRDDARAEREYTRSGGRARIERVLIQGQNQHVQAMLPQYLELIRYWRDSAAHGMAVQIGEEEAFLSMVLLLRYAAFADARWEELVMP